jgi:hypothetical protein
MELGQGPNLGCNVKERKKEIELATIPACSLVPQPTTLPSTYPL